MLHIGCHLSISKGFLHIGKEAQSIGADTFQFFTRNPQGGKAKDIDSADAQKYNDYARANGFAKIVAMIWSGWNMCRITTTIFIRVRMWGRARTKESP